MRKLSGKATSGQVEQGVPDDPLAAMLEAAMSDSDGVCETIASRDLSAIQRTELQELLQSQLDSNSPGLRDFLNSLTSQLGPEPLLLQLKSLHLGDLYLAWACEQRDESALKRFDESLKELVPAIASRGLNKAEIDEVMQTARIRLLVAEGDDRPRISLYTGRGRLGGFLRATVIRLSLNLRRSEKVQTSVVGQLQLLLESSHDPELEHLKNTYTAEFRSCLAKAWDEISQQEQLFLRHQLLDRLSIDHLAQLYDMHRTTAARRLISAKEALVRGTRKNLQNTLGISAAEVSSILRLIETRLELAVDVLD